MSEYYFEQMKALLGGRYADFKSAFDSKPRFKALRVNTLKISVEDFVALSEKHERAGDAVYGLKQNPLCPLSFYTCVKPSEDPLYHAGLYYMQEPSASAAITALSPFVGERVLDLCAAPGGKSTQVAAYMKNAGVLFCNDVESKRVRALKDNIARLGVRNAVVTQATADDYIDAGFCEYFDTLILDAPCSGGGMMRYENVPYSESIVDGCAGRQREIADGATRLLRNGGYLLYSTCTFAPQENEETVKYILDKGFVTVDTPLIDGVERGIGVPDARRIYPHNIDGEGHFYCVLKKTSGGAADRPRERVKTRTVEAGGLKIDCADYDGGPRIVGSVPKFDSLKKKVRGIGVDVGDVKKDGFWSYAAIHAFDSREIDGLGTVELGYAQAKKYIRGEQLPIGIKKGYYIATVDGFALGAVKSAPDGAGEPVLKNCYPDPYRI